MTDIISAAREKYCNAPPPGKPHGVTIPGSARPGYSAIYRHYAVGDGPLIETLDPRIRTQHEAFESGCAINPDANCLGWREYDRATKTWGPFIWMSYGTVRQRRTDLGAGIVQLHRQAGLPTRQAAIGLWTPNIPNWQLMDLAAMAYSNFTVSIYDTLGPSTTEYIINHGEISTVAATLNHIPTLLGLKDRLPSLKFIIAMDSIDDGEQPGSRKKDLLDAWAREKGVEILSIEEVEALGQDNPIPLAPPTPDDIITINYTSGTSGVPKGVVLTHRNAIGAITTSFICAPQNPGHVLLSYMPLAHIYERVSEQAALATGAAIGFFHGNILELGDDIKLLRPTGFCSVPRLYNRFYAGIKAATVDAPGFKGNLSRRALHSKLTSMKTGGTNKHMIFDRLWSNKIKAGLGFERVGTMITGSAPISPEVLQFLRAVFANDFFQGYGLTESYAVGSVQLFGDYSAGSTGPITPTLECCLMDVPEMEYRSTDKPYPRGEILLRGVTRFREYYKNPEQTAGAIDSDGWFHTGDVGAFDEMGRLLIIDRVKNILKLAQGEYVAPEKIENVYLANMNIFAQGYCHGDSHQSHLVGIFGVNPDTFAPYASKILGKHILPTDIAAIREACQHKSVLNEVLTDMEKTAKKRKLTGFERIRNVHLDVEPFSVDNELLTPTLKLKRPQAAKKFRPHIDALYAESQQPVTPKL
ncbi:S-dihydroxybenzoyltransferase [Drechslerella dactyloides]|uniref:S-dihydroxybenzoyltransferase n=1 Tax=Drechslerella dactyloides TaxID=74499 RepID=A0AAD6NKU2_DREDA|nr:S-dihydroxybenzoyltransferase [Drechslerella dactyloides]